jgi:virulence-associated protein VapD
MFAIAFDMSISKLKENFGEPYNNAYFEIKKEMQKWNFYNMQGSVYLTQSNDMANLFQAINGLKKIEWFKKSVRDIRAFRVEDWSDFTDIFTEGEI